MDHLPYPSHLDVPPVVVPFLDQFQFDHLDFETFPSRLGLGEVGNVLFRCVTHDSTSTSTCTAGCQLSGSWLEIAALAQSWLFFGLIEVFLEEPLDLGNLTKSTGETQSESRIIDTTLLEELLVDAVRCRGKHRKRTALDYKIRSLAIAHRVIDLYDMFLGRDPTMPVVALSIRILISYLINFFYHGLLINSDPFKKRMSNKLANLPVLYSGKTLQSSCAARFLATRMQQAGWCIRQTMQLLQNHNYWTIYYLSSIPRSEPPPISHRLCSEDKCCAYDTSDQEYRTYHVEEGCLCRFVEVPYDKVARIVDNGGIPLVDLASLTDFSNEVNVTEYISTSHYTAISHIWADGLGNLTRNALPWCQLHKLARQVSAMSEKAERLTQTWNTSAANSEGFSSSMVWLDTLCIPVSTATDNALRLKAINKMALIYAAAKKVLVIDKELEKICSVSEPIELLLARVLSSRWNTRCWTLQEGSLARRLFFQFQDMAVEPSMYDLSTKPATMELLGRTLSIPDMARTSLLQEEFRHFSKAVKSPLLSHLIRIVERYFLVRINLTFIKWQGPTLTKGFGREDLVGCLLVNVTSRLAARRYSIYPMVIGEELEDYLLEAHLFSTWRDIGCRSTTKIEDVHAIMANLTDFSAAQMLSFRSPTERTKAMLSVMKKMPLDLMFHKCSRGYAKLNHPDRWIPSAPTSESLSPSQYLTCTEEGLVVQSQSRDDLPDVFIVEGGILPSRFCFQQRRDRGSIWFWVDCEVEDDDQLPRYGHQRACLMIKACLGYVHSPQKDQGPFLKNQGARLLIINQWDRRSSKVYTRYDCPLTFRIKGHPPPTEELIQRPILSAVKISTNQKIVIDYHVDSAMRDKIVLRSQRMKTRFCRLYHLRYIGYFMRVLIWTLIFVLATELYVRRVRLWMSLVWILAFAYVSFISQRFVIYAYLVWYDSYVYNAWKATFTDERSGSPRERDDNQLAEGDIEMDAPLLERHRTPM